MPTYPTMEEARASGLFHCNCRHGTHAYLPGITDPMVGTEDPKGYEDAKKLRYLERKVREKKRMEAVAFTPEAKARAAKSLEDYRAKIRLHVDETGIRRQRWRESFGVRQKDLMKLKPRYPQGPMAGWSSELHTAVEEWTSGVDYADTRNAVGALVRGEVVPDTVAGRRAKVLFESMQSSPRYTGELSRSLHSLTPAQMEELTKVGSVHDLPLSSFSAKRDLSHQYLELQDAGKDSLSAEIVVEPTPGGVSALILTPGHGMSNQYTTEVLSSGRFEVKSVKQMYGAKGHYQPYKQITMRPTSSLGVVETPELRAACKTWYEGRNVRDIREASTYLISGKTTPKGFLGPSRNVIEDEILTHTTTLKNAVDDSPFISSPLYRSLHNLTPEQAADLTKIGNIQDLPLSGFASDKKMTDMFLVPDDRNNGPSIRLRLEPDGETRGFPLIGSPETEVLTYGRFEVASATPTKTTIKGLLHEREIPYTDVVLRRVVPSIPKALKGSKFFDDVAVAKLKRDIAKVTPDKAEKLLMAHMDSVLEEAGGNPVVALGRLEYLFAGKRKRAGSMLTRDVKSFVDGDDLPLQSVPELSKAAGWLDKYVNPNAFAGKGGVGVPSIRINPSGRPYCNTDLKQLVLNFDSSEGTILHELVHLSFQRDNKVQGVVRAHFARRTVGEDLTRIGVSPDEAGYRDKFIDHYAGRIYSSEKFPPGTELLSTGLEYMNVNPARLYQQDPELFKLTLAWMRGAI